MFKQHKNIATKCSSVFLESMLVLNSHVSMLVTPFSPKQKLTSCADLNKLRFHSIAGAVEPTRRSFSLPEFSMDDLCVTASGKYGSWNVNEITHFPAFD